MGTASSSSKTERLVVKLPSHKTPAKGGFIRKKYRRSLRKAYRQNDEFSFRNKQLQRGNKRLQKRIERIKKDKKKRRNETNDDTGDDYVDEDTGNENVKRKEAENDGSNENANNGEPIDDERDENAAYAKQINLTPKSKTQKEMRELRLEEIGTPKRIRKKINLVKKKILAANTISAEVTPFVVRKKTKNIRQHWRGISSKYRCSKAISELLGVGMKKVRKLGQPRKSKKNEMTREAVKNFLEREDNSSILTGKKDTKTENTDKKQKHVLSDYMKNLFQKFRFENPETKISKSLFYSMRPPHTVLANFASRRTCLCSRHQNLALKLRALISLGGRCSKNPDESVKKKNELLQQVT